MVRGLWVLLWLGGCVVLVHEVDACLAAASCPRHCMHACVVHCCMQLCARRCLPSWPKRCGGSAVCPRRTISMWL
jgi:hypothetical protein